VKVQEMFIGAALCGAIAWNSPVYSQAKDEKKPAADKPTASQPQPTKPADGKPAPATRKPADGEVDPRVLAWSKTAAPSDAHTKLKPTEGHWNTLTKQWNDPNSQPTETKGTCERKWIMEDRFMEEHYVGEFMGLPFEGKGIGGYDNVQKKYFTAWVDNMGTGLILFTGTADPSGKVFTYTGEHADPLTGKLLKIRAVMKIIDDKTHIFEMYGPGEDGKEFKTMEVIHTRK